MYLNTPLLSLSTLGRRSFLTESVYLETKTKRVLSLLHRLGTDGKDEKGH